MTRRVVLACIPIVALAGACLNGLTGGRPDSGTATDAAPDSNTLADAGSEAPADPGIYCTTQRCTTLTQVCCKKFDVNPVQCVARDAGGCPVNDTIGCTSAANCASLGLPNTVCCANGDDAGALGQYFCIDQATCLARPTSHVICEPREPECPDGSTCMPGVSTFFYCQ